MSNFNILKTDIVISDIRNLCSLGYFWCLHNPPNSDLDYRIFDMDYIICIYIYVAFLHVCTHGGPQILVSSKGLLWSVHRI